MRALRTAIALICAALLLAIVASNTATALNQYQDIFVTLSARPLGMGGAAVAVPQPASVFYNPAGLASLRRLTIMHNHSARHFGWVKGGGPLERDQLDGDTEAIIVPLPLSTYAHGWTASGEYGYDYRNHPDDYSLGYPRDHYWGTESYDALATSLGTPVALGINQRRSVHVFEPDPKTFEPAWVRLGEGNTWGIYCRLLPGLEYGYSEMKHDFDWTVLPGWQEALVNRGWDAPPLTSSFHGDSAAGGLTHLESRIRTKRSGFAFHPTGWMTLASDDVVESHAFRDPQAGYGSIHTGDRDVKRNHLGGELNVGNLGAFRWGMYDGRPTVGVSLNFFGLTANYAECADLLPEIIGMGDKWKNVHIYGFELKPL